MAKKIEIIKQQGLNRTFELFIGGSQKRGVTVVEDRKSSKTSTFAIYAGSIKLSRILSALKFDDYDLANIEEINFREWDKLDNFIIGVSIRKRQITITLTPNLQNWSGVYSHTYYFDNLYEILSKNYWTGLNNFSLVESKFVLIFFRDSKSISSESKSINLEISEKIKTLSKYHHRVINNFGQNIKNQDKRFVFAKFEFPEKIKVSCEQYLIYFAQFLRDLGINATPSLKEEAGKVLFSVTPTDDIEALDKIREALAVYLNLPSSPIVYDDSFAAMRLQQQIANLEHSQKMAVREIQLAEKVILIQSETIQEKNTIIAQKDSTIEQQNKIIEKISSKSIMMDSVQNKEELEEIYDGLKIGESKFLKEQLGIHLNPAKVIKSAVKNTFGKDGEKKSVLGLDEES